MELMAASVGDMVAPDTGGTPLPERHIAYILREVLNALVYLHSEHIMHRDIKGCNILLDSAGQVKLSDFGVSATLSNTGKRNTFIGSPLWMAPEVIEQSPDMSTASARQKTGYNEAADIWSLGISSIEMAQGEPPRSGVSSFRLLFLIVKEPPPQLEGGNFSANFRDFVDQCLKKDPRERPSAIDLLMHPFVATADMPEDLPSRIASFRATRAPVQVRGLVSLQKKGTAAAAQAEKAKPDESKNRPEETNWDFGTVKATAATKQEEPQIFGTTVVWPAAAAAGVVAAAGATAAVGAAKPPKPRVEVPTEMPSPGQASVSGPLANNNNRNNYPQQPSSSNQGIYRQSSGFPAPYNAGPPSPGGSGPQGDHALLKILFQPALMQAGSNRNAKDHRAAMAAANSAVAAFAQLEVAAPGSTKAVMQDVLALLAASTDPAVGDVQKSATILFGGKTSNSSASEVAPELGSLGSFLAARWRESIAREQVLSNKRGPS